MRKYFSKANKLLQSFVSMLKVGGRRSQIKVRQIAGTKEAKDEHQVMSTNQSAGLYITSEKYPTPPHQHYNFGRPWDAAAGKSSDNPLKICHSHLSRSNELKA